MAAIPGQPDPSQQQIPPAQQQPPDPTGAILKAMDSLAVAAVTAAAGNPDGAARLMQGVFFGAQALAQLHPPAPPAPPAPPPSPMQGQPA